MFDVPEVGMIVFDSVSAMTPKAEIEGEFGESKMGLQARMMGQAFRKIVAKAAKSDTTLIFINQLREKIGVMFASPITTTGGNALKFYASQRLDIAKIQNKSTDSNGDRMLNDIRVKVVKNKTAPPFRKANFKIRFGTGIDRLSEIIEYAVEVGLLQRKGTWFSYDGTNIGQGLEKTRNALIDNPELAEEIETKLLEILKDI
jgi:recombination protein RecA